MTYEVWWSSILTILVQLFSQELNFLKMEWAYFVGFKLSFLVQKTAAIVSNDSEQNYI